ncbi:MAG: AAA family ATPase [Duncaniella sp.]|nr:AAA family ATPase [Duncaniella sp.]
MTIGEFASDVTSRLPYRPNAQQEALIGALARFCAARPGGDVFILNGYAGTGKTSLTGALVRSLVAARRPVVLLAPTGRAAKVLSAQAGMPAFTIHRKIYRGGGGDWSSGFRALQHNTLDGAVYVVDEASMIGDTEGDSLLADLVEYVFTADNSRLLLLGDVAQLPPVGTDRSPALVADSYKRLGLRVSRAMLTDTARQTADSGILFNATWLRRAMLSTPLPKPHIFLNDMPDLALTDGNDIADVVGDCYRRDGVDQTILITRSNRRAREFNLGIRTRIFEYEEELLRGERLLVAKNNYMWAAATDGLDFIANGDVGIVAAIHSTEEKYGFRFADITLHLPDKDVDVECKIILDTLTDDGASLSAESIARLAEARMYDPDLHAPDDRYETRLGRLRRDKYFNALQVKYAYAVTCHKAQGAQWRNVVVDLGGIPPESQGLEFYRWLYTATTRATVRLYYLNGEEFVSGSGD